MPSSGYSAAGFTACGGPIKPAHSSLLHQGILYLLLGEFLLASMAAAIKAAATDVPQEMLVFWRNAFGFLSLLPILYLQNVSLSHLKTQCLRYHLLRALTGLTAMYGYFYMIRHIPLAEATLVKLSTPFFLPLVAYFWLKEGLNWRIIMGIFIGFCGVILILKPGTEHFSPIVLWGLLAAALASVAKVSIRKMGGSEPSVRIVFYFALLSTLFSAIPLSWGWHPIAVEHWLWLAGIGTLGTLGQIAMTQAYRIAPPGKIGVYTYATVIYASGFGWFFWGETLTYGTLFGTLLIVFAGIFGLSRGKS